MKMDELKTHLKRRELDDKGKKTELAARLRQAVETSGVVLDPLPATLRPLPAATSHRTTGHCETDAVDVREERALPFAAQGDARGGLPDPDSAIAGVDSGPIAKAPQGLDLGAQHGAVASVPDRVGEGVIQDIQGETAGIMGASGPGRQVAQKSATGTEMALGSLADLSAPVYIPSSPPPPETYRVAEVSGHQHRPWWNDDAAEHQEAAASDAAPSGWQTLAQLEAEDGAGARHEGHRWVPNVGRGQGQFSTGGPARAGALGGGPTCFRCGEVGHVISQCMEEDAWRGRRNDDSRRGGRDGRGFYRGRGWGRGDYQGRGNYGGGHGGRAAGQPDDFLEEEPDDSIPSYDELSGESDPEDYKGFLEALQDVLPQGIDPQGSQVNDMYRDLSGMKLGDAMRCPHGKYRMQCVNLATSRANREREAGILKISDEAKQAFPGAGDNPGELLFPDLYSDQELRYVGYTEEQIVAVRAPPEERKQRALAAALAKQAPRQPGRVKDSDGKDDTAEGPIEQDATVMAIAGSITYRPNSMTSEGQTTVVCADVEALCCAHPAVPTSLAPVDLARVLSDEALTGTTGVGGVASTDDRITFQERENAMGVREGGSWVQGYQLSQGRDGTAVAVGGGRIYVSGGMDERDMDLDVIESCGADGTWRREAFTTPVPMSFHASVVLDNRLYVLGGLGVERVMDQQCWRRDVYSIPLHDGEDKDGRTQHAPKWTPHAPMLAKRAFFGAVAVNGRIYAVGGRSAAGVEPDYTKGIPGLAWDTGHLVLNTVESFDPREGVWRHEPSMQAPAIYKTACHMRIAKRGLGSHPGARCCLGVAALGSRIFAIGGCDGEIVLDTVESWDVQSAEGWRSEPSLRHPRANLGACAAHGRVYAVGGWDGKQDLPTVESLEVGEGSWRSGPPLEIPRSNLAVATV